MRAGHPTNHGGWSPLSPKKYLTFMIERRSSRCSSAFKSEMASLNPNRFGALNYEIKGA